MTRQDALVVEWERLELLGNCLAESRKGATINDDIQVRLEVIQQKVMGIRQRAPWSPLIAAAGLGPLDQDILASVIAPDAQPKLGWMYQELQSGMPAAYPSPALLRELLFLDSTEGHHLLQRLEADGPLRRGNLVQVTSTDQFQPIRPTPKAKAALLGWMDIDAKISPPPGCVEIRRDTTWEDLILPGTCITTLREYLFWVEYRDKVEQQWGGKVEGGPVALFSGPSGTGKTLAASVLANALGWPLYRVDLGMVVSKYIGETEKNLSAIFEAADSKPIVLLFDEADSLFGKRGEIKEARDRYANMEVSHLLSRMERHWGPCILTTNLRHQMDPAFARRFQMVIEFPRPDTQAREQLWQLYLPPRAPYTGDVNATMLAQTLQVTGGQIRNIALHAAFLAAGGEQPISNRHIAKAARLEMAKSGGETIPAMLGELARYLEGNGVV